MTRTKRSRKAKREEAGRRSPCPVACTLDVLGDRWTLLVVRDMALGRSRFKEFAASPEGIPTNVLSERLVRMVRMGIVERKPGDTPRRLAYGLTAKGKALMPVLREMRDWGLEWMAGTKVLLTKG